MLRFLFCYYVFKLRHFVLVGLGEVTEGEGNAEAVVLHLTYFPKGKKLSLVHVFVALYNAFQRSYLLFGIVYRGDNDLTESGGDAFFVKII